MTNEEICTKFNIGQSPRCQGRDMHWQCSLTQGHPGPCRCSERQHSQPSNPDQPVLELMHFSGCNEDGDGSGD